MNSDLISFMSSEHA